VFQKTRHQLLLSYLTVLAAILGIFVIAVRVVFTRSLNRQLINELTALGHGAVANAEFEQGRLQVEGDLSSKELIARHQALQWFDLQGHVIAQQGQNVLNLPLSVNQPVQLQTGRVRLRGVTLPVIKNDSSPLIGYVRASQSLETLDDTLEKLDWGLGSGVAIALVFSGIGGILLTRQAMQPIEQSFQRLKQFTADASHELRSPLMAIKSNAAVALKYPEGMRTIDTEKFKAITSAVSQMTRLTEDLLLLARTEQIPNSDRATINLEELLDSLVLLYKPQAQAKQIELTAHLSNLNVAPGATSSGTLSLHGRAAGGSSGGTLSTGLYLLGDSVQLTQLFTNLIENALQYTPIGGKVEIQTSRSGRHLWVSVRDTGVGIAPEHIELVFERFWRADQSRSYWAGGSGLGLAIAQAIAKNHGGLITVTSQMGVGSCFTVRLSAGAS